MPHHLVQQHQSVFSRSYFSHRMIGYWHHTVVCPSVCDAVHCG